MRILVPFTEVQVATRIALRAYEVEYWDVEDYATYWQVRWDEGTDFINVEHDVVPYPGAIESLESCPEPWCAYGYHLNDLFADHVRTLFPYLGCVKITHELIALTKDCWSSWEDPDWLVCDKRLAEVARSHGLDVHQHFPPVTNANPLLQ